MEDGLDRIADPEVARDPTLGTPTVSPDIFKFGFGTVVGEGFGHGQHFLEPAHVTPNLLVGPGTRDGRLFGSGYRSHRVNGAGGGRSRAIHTLDGRWLAGSPSTCWLPTDSGFAALQPSSIHRQPSFR